MISLNKRAYIDKLHACWIGKNIGGTLGGPYEGRRDVLDVKGFSTEFGSPLPNDDLDLQLLWLLLLEKHSSRNITSQLLADYWINSIPPFWNEYGICKTNMMYGLLPPLCGELHNNWKNSNGAWIRSEIWAAIAPGVSDIAIKYAAMDAMVDHGISEGTYAEIFTAAIQSLAYCENDINILLNTALSKIPEDCKVAKAVRLVMEEYEKQTDYKTVRQRLVEQSADLGFFQAPANLGYVTIGLLYGKGDFKKSVLYAINCGDDTDCTAATVGATLGIMYGGKVIPADWREYIGDNIITCAINGQNNPFIPKSCTELTDRIVKLVPNVMFENEIEFEFCDDAIEGGHEIFEKYNELTWEDFLNRSPYSFDITTHSIFDVRVSYSAEPIVRPGEIFEIKLSLYNRELEVRQPSFRVILPQGWTTDYYAKTMQVKHNRYQTGNPHKSFNSCLIGTPDDWMVTLQVGEVVEAINRVYIEIIVPDCPSAAIIPIVLLG